MYSVDSLKYHILSFRVCGLWPNLNGGWLYDCWSALFLICVAFGFPLSQLVCVIFVDSVDGVVEQLLLTSTVAIASAKGFNIYIQKRRLAKLFGILNGMDDELAIDSKSKYKEVFDPLKKIGTVLSFMFLGAYGTAWAILAVQVILSTPEKRAGWSSTYLYPSEYLHKPSIYVGGLFYQGASNLILCAVDAALDTMPVILLNILVGHIEMLKILLREIDTSGRFRQESTQHQALVRVCKNYQKIEKYDGMLGNAYADSYKITHSLPFQCLKNSGANSFIRVSGPVWSFRHCSVHVRVSTDSGENHFKNTNHSN